MFLGWDLLRVDAFITSVIISTLSELSDSSDEFELTLDGSLSNMLAMMSKRYVGSMS